MAIHEAHSSDEIGQLLRAFFAGLPAEERALLRPDLLEVATYSDSAAGQEALNAARAELFDRAGDPARAAPDDVTAVLAAAALRLSVIEMEAS